MKRFLSLLALFALLLTPRAVFAAQVDPGTIVATFPFAPSKVLSDPVRNRVYVIVPLDNSLRVINTLTLDASTVIKLPVDSIPVDMVLSRDHQRLYIANSGSTVHAISVVGNLDATPFYIRSIALNGPGLGVAATVDANTGHDKLFVQTAETLIIPPPPTDPTAPPTVKPITPILVVDAMSTDQSKDLEIGEDNVVHTFVGTSFNGDSVLVTSSLGLEQFDATTGDRQAADPNLGTNAIQLIESNTGKYLCAPDPAGNGGGNPLTTILFDTSGLTRGTVGYFGTFSDPATPGPLAFTPADLFIYQLRFTATGTEVVVFSTTTFLETESFALPTNNVAATVQGRNTIALDSTGSYVFVGESVSFDINATGQLIVVSTGRGPLTPPVLPPVITSVLTANGTEGVPFTYQIEATNTPSSFDAVGLPAGLVVNTATGLISGTPADVGIFTVTISATNSGGTTSARLELEIDPNDIAQVPVVTTTALPDGAVGQFYSAQVTATNTPTDFGAIGLPAGLSINATTGVIAGIPTIPGLFSVVLSATNGAGTGSVTLPLTITGVAAAPPVINSPTTLTVSVSTPFTYQITATNSPTGYGANGLPAGVTLNTTTGVISGTVTTTGTFSVFLSATNAGGTGTALLMLTVAPEPAPVISSPNTASGTLGQGFDYQITASNNPISYAASGLPPGLGINSADGLISGVPLASGTFPVIVSATNVSATGTLSLTLTVASDVPVIEIVATVPRVTVGTDDSAAFTINRTGDLSQVLVVAYAIRGSARNGTDYVMISGRKKIKANKSSATIQIFPKGTDFGSAVRAVKLVLEPAVTYQLGTATKAKVKILPAD